MDNNGIQVPSGLVKSILSPLLQPGANLQQTQTGIQNTSTNTALQNQEIPGATAKSTSDQVTAQKDKASIQIGQDFKSGMTLQDGMHKYNGLIAPDQIFSNYIQAGYYGLPKQSSNQLKAMGVDSKVLGQMDQPGDFMNRQNIASAVGEMNQLENMYNSLSDTTKYVPGMNKVGQGKVYEQLRSQIAAHLSGIFPNTPSGEGNATRILNMLPSAGNPTNYNIAGDIFSNAKGNLLTGNNYKDPSEVGLTAKDIGPQISTTPQGQQQPQQSSGSALLNNIVQQANGQKPPLPPTGGNKIHVGENATPNGALPIVGATLAPMVADILSAGGATRFNPEISSAGAGAGQTIQDLLYGKKVGADVPETMATTEALERSGLAASKLVGGGAKVVGESGATQRLPSFMKSLMRTGAGIGQTNNARNALVQDATGQGVKVNGNDIYNNIVQWAKNKVPASSSANDRAFVQNAVSDAANDFKGKTFTPQQAKNIYDQITEGYTVKGAPRTTIEAETDAARKQAISKVMGDNVKGWDQANSKFRQLNQLDNSPLKKYSARVATGVSTLMGLLGLKEYQNLVAP